MARLSLLTVLALFCATPLHGQLPATGPGYVPELRLDVLAARATLAQLGVGVSLGKSGYTRGIFTAAAGVAAQGGQSRPSARFDAQARFYLDPYRASPWGLYGAAGVGALYDGFQHWRALVTATAGIELPTHSKTAWAIEAGLGGGARIGVVLRAARPDHR